MAELLVDLRHERIAFSFVEVARNRSAETITLGEDARGELTATLHCSVVHVLYLRIRYATGLLEDEEGVTVETCKNGFVQCMLGLS